MSLSVSASPLLPRARRLIKTNGASVAHYRSRGRSRAPRGRPPCLHRVQLREDHALVDALHSELVEVAFSEEVQRGERVTSGVGEGLRVALGSARATRDGRPDKGSIQKERLTPSTPFPLSPKGGRYFTLSTGSKVMHYCVSFCGRQFHFK